MIIVNTKNRNMPHPLHNFKINGKMKYFTDVLRTNTSFSAYLKSFVLVLFCTLASLNVNAQCDFLNAPPNPTIDSPTSGSHATVPYIAIRAILMPSGVGCNMYWINPNNSADTSLFTTTDEVHVFCPNATINVAKDSIFSGDSITFLVGTSLAGPFDKATVTFLITDTNNNTPTFNAPRDTIVECQRDTSVAMLGNIMNVFEPCVGIKDTIRKDSFITTGSSITADTILRIYRMWTVTDNDNNIERDTQRIIVIDTIPPRWDTLQLAANIFLQDDSIYWNGFDTLKVVLDTSGTVGANTSDFWTNSFVPTVFDSCFEVLDTLFGSELNLTTGNNINPFQGEVVTGSGSSIMARRPVLLRELIYTPTINRNIQSSNAQARNIVNNNLPPFVLQLFFIDTLPPVVIDTPFIPLANNSLTTQFLEGGDIDTFIVNNLTDTCGNFITAADISITARDSFSKDSVLYNWKVETTFGSAPTMVSAGGFASKNNAAAQFYPVGVHKITYTFQDSTNARNEDSLQFVLIVRDTQGIRIDYPSTTFVNNSTTSSPIRVDTLTVDATINSCTNAVNWLEPSSVNFVNCSGIPLVVAIERKFIAGPDPTIFDGFPAKPAGNSVTGIFPVGKTVFQYVFEEQFGVKDSFQIEVTVLDKQKPNAVCKNLTLLLDVDGKDTITVADINGGSTDNCGIDTMYLSRDTFGCGDLGTAANVWLIVRDSSNNVDSCQATVTVDFIPIPLADTLADANINCDEVVIFAPIALDNCTDTIYGVNSLGTSNNTTPPSYTFTNSGTIIWTFIDRDGNSVSQAQRIQLSTDITPPVIVTPTFINNPISNPVIILIDSMGMADFAANNYNVTVTDNCSPVGSINISVDTTGIDQASVGKQFDVRIIAEDEKGNKDTAILNVKIQLSFADTLPPFVVDTPFIPLANSSIVTQFLEGGTIDTFVVNNTKDLCGTMIDSTDIRITARDSFSKDSVFYNWKVETMSGNRPVVVDGGGFTSSNNDAAQLYPVGMHKITYIFQDTTSRKNEDSLQFVLIVRDTQGIKINYPSATFVNNPTTSLPIRVDTLSVDATINGCTEALNWIEPNGTSLVNCTGPLVASIERKFVSGPDATIFDGFPAIPAGNSVTGIFPVGKTVFQYVFEEQFGIKDSFQIEVTVLDEQKPNAVCQNFTLLLDIDGKDTITVADINGGSTDNCGIDTMYLSRDTFGCSDLGTAANVWLIVRDFSNNVDSCRATVTVDFKPIPLRDTLRDVHINCTEVVVEAPMALDNCIDTLFGVPTQGMPNNTTPPSYTFTSNGTIIWSFIDRDGNTVSQIQRIALSADTTPPVIDVPPVIFFPPPPVLIPIDSMGMADFSVNNLNIIVTDNCSSFDSLKVSVDTTGINCTSVDTAPFDVRVIAEDEKGNRDTAILMVQIIDDMAPYHPNVPNDTLLSCGDAIPQQMMLPAIENCGAIDSVWMEETDTRPDTSTALNITFADLRRNPNWYNYTIFRSWFARDTSGNIGFSDQLIEVRDTLAPVLTYTNPLLTGSAPDATNCSAKLSINLLTDLIEDCSDTIFTAVNFLDGNGFIQDTTLLDLTIPMGIDSIIIRSTDVTGNTSLDTLRIIVDDKTDPRPRCINSVAVTLNAFGYVTVDSSIINQNSIDNCTNFNNLRFELSRDTFRCPEVGGTYPVIMTVIDEAGNRASCSSQVTIQDFTGTGSFACAANVTIACNASIDPADTGTPTVTDICGDNSSLTFSDKVVAGSGVGDVCQIIERTWVATDTSGTATTCVQLISLVDDTAPVLTQTFSDITVACIADGVTADSILATDNCVADAYVQAVETITIGTGKITLERIWTASDSCRTVADTQLITILDVTAPLIDLPSDTFVYNTGDHIPDSCGVFVTLNFANFVTDCNAVLGSIQGLRVGYNGQDTTALLTQYFTVGEHIVTITAKDTSGNIATKDILIDVNDTSIPTIICVENLVISLGTGGTGTLQVSNVESSISDNCGGGMSIDTTFLSQTIFDCTDLGLQQVTLTAIDTSGNVGTCISNINVVNQGNTDFISIETASKDESIIGLNDGEAWVNITGGSGNYSTQWNDAAMSTTDTIKNLAPALYTVTVNDETTGCRLTDTIRVNEGSTVTYGIGDITGMPGEIVQVPIRVTNFRNVTSIDMSFNLSNPTVAQFIAGNEAGGFNVPGIDLAGFNIDPSNSSRLLFSPSLDFQDGESVPDSTVIFYINVQLAANATIGSTSDILGGGILETAIKTSVLINNSPVDLMALSTSGKVTVTNVDNSLTTFGGQIHLMNGNAFANATVILSGDISREDSTGIDGQYNATVTSGQNVTITPMENENARNGLSTFDLVLIQDHINRRLLDSPYKRLAADVNKSGSVSVLDIIEIQDVILKRIPDFTNVSSWVFVPADYVFADTLNPYQATVPTSINVPSAGAADTALNFVAIKTGDVSFDAKEIRLGGDVSATDRNKEFAFRVRNQLLEKGTYVEIPFKANNFNEVRGYQMTLDIAKEWLSFESVKAGALTNITADNFSFTNIAQGQIATNWFDATAQTVEDGATLFTLVFKVNQTGSKLSEVLDITSDMIQSEAYTDDLFYNGIDLVFEENLAITEAFELFQNKPNPFRSETTISFNLPENAPATLRFFDFSGRLVHRIKGEYTRGMNNITIHKNDLSANGVLYYELSTQDFTARKKMIVLE